MKLNLVNNHEGCSFLLCFFIKKVEKVMITVTFLELSFLSGLEEYFGDADQEVKICEVGNIQPKILSTPKTVGEVLT